MPTVNSSPLSSWQQAATGPATLAQVMQEVEQEAAAGGAGRLVPLPTGFSPLDDILNGGLHAGELLVVGGPFGVGKTIWALQAARNLVRGDPDAAAMYVCYEHDRSHLLSRLLCLESAEVGYGDDALTLRRLNDLATGATPGLGPIGRLRHMPRYAPIVEAVDSYAGRLILAKASGDHTTLDQARRWISEALERGPGRLLVAVDYLQKIPVAHAELTPETEVTTYLTQGLKEMAMALNVAVIAVAASDRTGLKTPRMRLSDLRGSSALQYEADVGLILNNKYAILSREHMIYNLSAAEAMRNWVVISVEKNRAGRNAVDLEFALDAAHFRMAAAGDFVRERLVDEKVVLA
jgi:replicative DNA helicase